MSTEKTIPVVDDEASIRQSIVDYFEDCLWRVVVAESGETALALLENESPWGHCGHPHDRHRRQQIYPKGRCEGPGHGLPYPHRIT